MKKEFAVASAIFMSTALSFGNSSAMSQMVFDSQSEFEKHEGQFCSMASDGCNSFGVEDGKITYGTEMYCENHTPKWSCIDYKEERVQSWRYIVKLDGTKSIDEMIESIDEVDGIMYEETIFDVGDTKMLVVTLAAPMLITDLENLDGVEYIEEDGTVSINNLAASSGKSISLHYGEITKIENGTDGVMIYVTDAEGTTFSTAVSLVTDTVKGGSIDELYLGTRVKVFYYDSVASMGLVIGDDIEIVSDGLSDNDRNYFNVLKGELDTKFQSKVQSVLDRYVEKVSAYDIDKQLMVHNKLVERVETIISEMLMEFPQDIALPKNAAEKYSRLEFIKFSLMDIDLYANWK